MRRRFLFVAQRLAGALGVCGALWLAACGGGSTAVDPVPRQDSALPASKPGDLLAYVQARLRTRQSSAASVDVATGNVAPPIFAVATSGGAERSGTTVQEQGVDEDDLIKTDGAVLYTLNRNGFAGPADIPAQLELHRRNADGSLQWLARLALPPAQQGQAAARGMYLASGAARLAVLGEVQTVTPFDPCPVGMACITTDLSLIPPAWTQPSVQLDLVNVADPSRPALGDRLRIDGRLVGSRLIGNSLVLVTQHAPRLVFDMLPATATAAEREAAITALKAGDLLPTFTVNGGAPQPLHAETDCYLQPKNTSPAVELASITVVDLASPTLQRSSRCFVGGAEGLYMSTSHLYLATTRSDWSAGATTIRYAPQFSTDIHKFRLEATGVSYRGSGEVSGHLGWDAQRKSYRMSEHEGDLRVLSFTGELGWFGLPVIGAPAAAQSAPPSPATLTVLRERSSDATLQVIAQLPNSRRPQALGHPGEQVYAVRFVGARGYLVTFRQFDPLYVLDLADPTDPKAVGELLMPGFSDYLYPLEGGLLFGVGRDADELGRVGGVKVALFDVADAAQPRTLATLILGERGSSTGLDVSAHALNYLQLGGAARIALPMVVYPGSNAPVRYGLQRFEVDTQARTLRSRSMIQPAASPAFPDLSGDRSVQIGAQVYYLSQGLLIGTDW